MNLVDSCGWLEYFSNGINADFFATSLEKTELLIVPSICIYEVFKRTLQQRDENSALQAISLMQQARVIDFSSTLALAAAKLSIQHKLPLADAVVLATARAYKAQLWTQDADFEGIEGVKYKKK